MMLTNYYPNTEVSYFFKIPGEGFIFIVLFVTAQQESRGMRVYSEVKSQLLQSYSAVLLCALTRWLGQRYLLPGKYKNRGF